jgi:SAM-dependent methyltransferase
MVYFATTNELAQAYSGIVGVHDAATPLFRQDSDSALTLANLSPGQSVLEIGAGSGRLIAMAKGKINDGFCVAVDAVQGFINTDIPWALHRAGLSVYPSSTPNQDVHLLCALATDPDFRDRIRALPGAPQDGFDCIFAMHVLGTVPPGKRRELLRTLRRLLKPGGFLIADMSARFCPGPPSPAHAGIPVLFRDDNYTEAPGCSVVFRTLGTVDSPRGPATDKVAYASLQTSPNQLWTSSAQQAREAATDVGFNVDNCIPVGKGNVFGLATLSGSPAQATLQTMPRNELLRRLQPDQLQQGYRCVGRALFTWVSRAPAFPGNQSGAEQEGFFALQAQQITQTFAQTTYYNHGYYVEHAQVGSLVKLGKV